MYCFLVCPSVQLPIGLNIDLRMFCVLWIYTDILPQEESQEDVDEEEQAALKVSIGQILKLNTPEWPYMLVGVICSSLQGTTIPIFAILFGEVLGVSIWHAVA